LGTFGAGLFLNDTAADLLTELARATPSNRLERITEILQEGADAPNEDESEVLPEEVAAAAAVLAANLHYSSARPAAEEWPNGIEAWLPQDIDDSIITAAIRAMDIHTGPGTWWRSSWDSEEEQAASIDAVERIRAVLEQAL
jgi:hypothetical protein